MNPISLGYLMRIMFTINTFIVHSTKPFSKIIFGHVVFGCFDWLATNYTSLESIGERRAPADHYQITERLGGIRF